jgi:hypothetical protein
LAATLVEDGSADLTVTSIDPTKLGEIREQGEKKPEKTIAGLLFLEDVDVHDDNLVFALLAATLVEDGSADLTVTSKGPTKLEEIREHVRMQRYGAVAELLDKYSGKISIRQKDKKEAFLVVLNTAREVLSSLKHFVQGDKNVFLSERLLKLWETVQADTLLQELTHGFFTGGSSGFYEKLGDLYKDAVNYRVYRSDRALASIEKGRGSPRAPEKPVTSKKKSIKPSRTRRIQSWVPVFNCGDKVWVAMTNPNNFYNDTFHPAIVERVISSRMKYECHLTAFTKNEEGSCGEFESVFRSLDAQPEADYAAGDKVLIRIRHRVVQGEDVDKLAAAEGVWVKARVKEKTGNNLTVTHTNWIG